MVKVIGSNPGYLLKPLQLDRKKFVLTQVFHPYLKTSLIKAPQAKPYLLQCEQIIIDSQIQQKEVFLIHKLILLEMLWEHCDYKKCK